MGKKGAQTKDALADALVSILLNNEPGAITVKAVAETAGVDRQTFYYHFEGMEGLIGYLSEREVGALATGLEKELSLDELAKRFICRVFERKRVIKGLLDHFGRSTLKRLLHDKTVKLLRSYAQRELAAMGASIDARYCCDAVEYCALASASVLEAWIMNELEMDTEQLSCFLVDSFRQHLIGLAATKGQI